MGLTPSTQTDPDAASVHVIDVHLDRPDTVHSHPDAPEPEIAPVAEVALTA